MSYHNGPRIVTNGLVLYLDAGNSKSYPGSGTVWNDLSGNGNNGTLINGPTYSNSNKGSIVFDGINDVVQTNTNDILGTNPFAIDIWFRPNGIQASASTLICIGAPQASSNWQLSFTSTNILEFRDGTNLNPSTYTATSAWANVVVTRQSTATNGLKIYINGIFNAQGTAINNFSQIANYRIGQNRAGAAYYNGNISIVRIYTKFLNPEEIQQNYNATKGRYNL